MRNIFMGADNGTPPKTYKVVVKRTIVLTTEIEVTFAFSRRHAFDIAMTDIEIGKFESMKPTIQSWIEQSPIDWKFQEETDCVASIRRQRADV